MGVVSNENGIKEAGNWVNIYVSRAVLIPWEQTNGAQYMKTYTGFEIILNVTRKFVVVNVLEDSHIFLRSKVFKEYFPRQFYFILFLKAVRNKGVLACAYPQLMYKFGGCFDNWFTTYFSIF